MTERVTRTKYIDLGELSADPTWPTRRQDLLAALQIMNDYETRTGQPLRLLDAWGETAEGQFWVQLPEWIIELVEHFQARYGERAERIVQWVVQELLPVDTLH